MYELYLDGEYVRSYDSLFLAMLNAMRDTIRWYYQARIFPKYGENGLRFYCGAFDGSVVRGEAW